MYVLDTDEFGNFDLELAEEFINFWSGFYEYRVLIADENNPISYHNELNIGNELTEQNIIRLLRWKDPRLLTAPNPIVDMVIDNLDSINDFRFNVINQEDFLQLTHNIFLQGIVWKIFFFILRNPFSILLVTNMYLEPIANIWAYQIQLIVLKVI